MTEKQFNANGRKIDKLWKKLWYECVIRGDIND
jgi:hypothetical protein